MLWLETLSSFGSSFIWARFTTRVVMELSANSVWGDMTKPVTVASTSGWVGICTGWDGTVLDIVGLICAGWAQKPGK